MERSLLLVGGGKMGRALAQGMIRAQVLDAARLTVAEKCSDSRQWWSENVPLAKVTGEVKQVTDRHDIVILAVKPHHLKPLIQDVREARPKAWQDSLVVSVAAGITLKNLSTWLHSQRIVRVMPNTPALVGAGAAGFCCGHDVTAEDRDSIQQVLAAIGIAEEVPENQLDAITGVSGSGPAYVFMFIEALADGGVMAGLPRDKALKLATQTVLGAARMVQETGEHPGALKDAVASPGGTTIAAIRTLEHNAFRGAVIDAVMAATVRSREISCS